MYAAPPLALTMGDPAGIGPEITRAAWHARREGPVFLVVADPVLFPEAQTIRHPAEAEAVFGHALPVLPLTLPAPAVPGRPDTRHAQAILDSITRATLMALDGDVAAVVTNPISKAHLQEAGFAHPGHTEFLAELTGSALPVMMLASPLLRVVPVTIHVALKAAVAMLSTEAIVAATRITESALRRDFGIARPRLAIAGLNPHAGENGHMGDEEFRLIQPAIEALRAEGLDVSGPWPPDTMFTPRARARYDAAICMYHDQGLIPLKTLDMEGGVNVTLGLPIIRTSPDHGTAFDIAGKGVADPASLLAAIDLAAMLASRKETVS